MRLDRLLFNSTKELIYKIPGIRNLFLKIESYFTDALKFIDLRRYLRRKLKDSTTINENQVIKFKILYEKNYFDKNLKRIIEFAEKRINSAWKGHQYFALWLVKELNPKIIVDLGVDKGFSTFIFAAQKIGKVYGIDWFRGMSVYKEERLDYVSCMRNKRLMQKKFGIQNVTIIISKFSNVVKKWKIPIDILHIDGTHSYTDIKEDYQSWGEFLNENSVVLIHDTNIYKGAKQFFKELELPKFNFTHSYGLGVASKNEDLILKMKQMWDI